MKACVCRYWYITSYANLDKNEGDCYRVKSDSATPPVDAAWTLSGCPDGVLPIPTMLAITTALYVPIPPTKGILQSVGADAMTYLLHQVLPHDRIKLAGSCVELRAFIMRGEAAALVWMGTFERTLISPARHQSRPVRQLLIDGNLGLRALTLSKEAAIQHVHRLLDIAEPRLHPSAWLGNADPTKQMVDGQEIECASLMIDQMCHQPRYADPFADSHPGDSHRASIQWAMLQLSKRLTAEHVDRFCKWELPQVGNAQSELLDPLAIFMLIKVDPELAKPHIKTLISELPRLSEYKEHASWREEANLMHHVDMGVEPPCTKKITCLPDEALVALITHFDESDVSALVDLLYKPSSFNHAQPTYWDDMGNRGTPFPVHVTVALQLLSICGELAARHVSSLIGMLHNVPSGIQDAHTFRKRVVTTLISLREFLSIEHASMLSLLIRDAQTVSTELASNQQGSEAEAGECSESGSTFPAVSHLDTSGSATRRAAVKVLGELRACESETLDALTVMISTERMGSSEVGHNAQFEAEYLKEARVATEALIKLGSCGALQTHVDWMEGHGLALAACLSKPGPIAGLALHCMEEFGLICDYIPEVTCALFNTSEYTAPRESPQLDATTIAAAADQDRHEEFCQSAYKRANQSGNGLQLSEFTQIMFELFKLSSACSLRLYEQQTREYARVVDALQAGPRAHKSQQLIEYADFKLVLESVIKRIAGGRVVEDPVNTRGVNTDDHIDDYLTQEGRDYYPPHQDNNSTHSKFPTVCNKAKDLLVSNLDSLTPELVAQFINRLHELKAHVQTLSAKNNPDCLICRKSVLPHKCPCTSAMLGAPRDSGWGGGADNFDGFSDTRAMRQAMRAEYKRVLAQTAASAQQKAVDDVTCLTCHQATGVLQRLLTVLADPPPSLVLMLRPHFNVLAECSYCNDATHEAAADNPNPHDQPELADHWSSRPDTKRQYIDENYIGQNGFDRYRARKGVSHSGHAHNVHVHATKV